MATDILYFNGINGETGEYALPPASPGELADRVLGGRPDNGDVATLRSVLDAKAKRLEHGDDTDLAQAGWGVIFAQNDEKAPAIREALSELLDHRRAQAGRLHEHYYQEYMGPKGFHPEDTDETFLARFGLDPGPADPDRMPYYLLLVGDPETIPFEFQYQLDMPYAVGRLHFDTLEEYARYAHDVVQAETAPAAGRGRRCTLFAPQHPGDPATQLTARGLAEPLAKALAGRAPGWEIRTVLADEATKARLTALLGGVETPDLLFTAGHGLVIPNGKPRQPLHQGALLCQGWAGPQAWLQPVSPDCYFAAEDLAPTARLDGSITFHFACYSGGTPVYDDFAVHQQVTAAPHPFVARLPQRLLAAGALAVIAHVEHAWQSSIEWPGAGLQTRVFEETLARLLAGHPVGQAMERFAERYAALAINLALELEKVSRRQPVNETLLAALWMASNDARNFAVLGDPAVRLAAAQEKKP